MAERGDRPNGFVEFLRYGRDVLLTPISYARELRERGIIRRDLPLLSLVTLYGAAIGWLAAQNYIRTGDLAQTVTSNLGIVAISWLTWGVVANIDRIPRR